MRSILRFVPVAALVGASFLSVTSAPQTARAERSTYTGKLSTSLQGEAKEAFSRAISLFEVGNYDAARVEFEQAHAASGDPRVLYNVAVCDKELGRYARAIDELERSLEAGRSALPSSYVRRVEQTIRTLRPFVTQMRIDSPHDGAEVFVDGERVGTLPLRAPISIDVGEHEVKLEKKGYRGETVRVQAKSGQPLQVQPRLEPVALRQQIKVFSPGTSEPAEVLIDGAVVGETPWSGEVDVGKRRITVRADGYAASTRLVEVKEGPVPTFRVSLQESDRRGRVKIRTGHEQNTIRIDGRVVGRGSYEGRIAPGEHTLRVSRPDAETYDVDFVVAPRETRSMTVTLEEGGGVPAWLWIAGGVVVAGATTATILLTNRETQYDGQTPGTLPPRVVPASYRIGY